jgi:ferritin-like metal-binding protein YciE
MQLPINLTNSLVAEIKDLYSAEIQLIHELPEMVKAASDVDLKEGLAWRVAQVRHQAERLQQVAELLDTSPRGKICLIMKSLISEGAVSSALPAGRARDASLICLEQKVERHELASLGAVRTYAQVLGRDDVAELLQAALDEEMVAQGKFAILASRLNPSAKVA